MVYQAGGYSREGRELLLGCTVEVARIEGPPDPLRLLREFVLPAVPTSSIQVRVQARVAAGAGVGIGAGEGDLKQVRRDGGALLSSCFCCSRRGC
jgi:hypothetical protein